MPSRCLSNVPGEFLERFQPLLSQLIYPLFQVIDHGAYIAVIPHGVQESNVFCTAFAALRSPPQSSTVGRSRCISSAGPALHQRSRAAGVNRSNCWTWLSAINRTTMTRRQYLSKGLSALPIGMAAISASAQRDAA